MTTDPSRHAAPMGWLVVACAWVVYLPLGVQYLALVACALLSLAWLHRSGRWPTLWRSPLLWVPLSLWLWLALSSVWSSAALADQSSHLWHYGRPLLIPVIALACTPGAARRALGHFVGASVVVAMLTVLAAWQTLPASPLWASTVDATGNQRIATSLLMALGAGLALVQATDRALPRQRRPVWLLAAVLIGLGLTLQDRRTGMVVLPLLLAALAIAHHRSWRRALLMVTAVVLVAAMALQMSDGVRARFAEGIAELNAYRSNGEVNTSWGMRLRMAELSLDMVRERPVLGHGIASWPIQWLPLAQGGGRQLEGQGTPHNEYLLITVQAGLVGLVLWFAILATYLRQAWRAGQNGHASLLVWTAVASAGLFNVVIRDAKFAVPLILLAALALAASRADPVDRQ